MQKFIQNKNQMGKFALNIFRAIEIRTVISPKYIVITATITQYKQEEKYLELKEEISQI